MNRPILILFLFLYPAVFYGQPCTTIGQTPSTAFPVCGNSVFTQSVVPLCGSYTMIVPCDTSIALYQDRNPYWYKFRCYTSGTLGFLITPMDLLDDYDWQLFDVTGKNPDAVFTDPTCFVSCNWSGYSGVTGASTAGVNLNECAGDAPIFSIMPTITAGRDYLLLISHYTNSQAGYTLQFTGGTAVINDPLLPTTISASAADCEGRQITVRFNKKLLCSSLASDGSDFIITPGGNIQSVIGHGCANGFDMDSATIILSAPLNPGTYTVSVVNGNDGNTITDNCGTGITVNESESFTITAGPPLPMGTIAPAFCSPSSVLLNLPDSVYCNSIAADGSDFIVTGASPVIVTSASFSCDANGMTKYIAIQFSAPVINLGTYQVSIKTGTDGNTLIGRCNRRVNVGSTASFTLSDDPAARFLTSKAVGCSPTVIGVKLTGIVQCSSVATDGSDFFITGPSMVSVISATPICGAVFTDSISILVSSPITIGGNYQLNLQSGTDGNTLLNNCNRPSVAGESSTFTVADTVSANFTWQVMPGCRPTNVVLSHIAGNPVTMWAWEINGTAVGNQANYSQVLSGSNLVKLTVSNGFCNDTDSFTVDIEDNNINVAIISPDQICTGDSIYFQDGSSGVIDTWSWNFGNGSVSNQQTPPGQIYPVTGTDIYYTITLTASNNTGCSKTKSRSVKALKTCRIEVPTGFTPNNDGKNDYLYPINGFNAEKLEFKVYNRWGQLIFQTNNGSGKWDGRIDGKLQATEVYLWTLSYIEKNTGRLISSKGTSVLIR